MAVPKSVVTDAELNILKALWDCAPRTARDISDCVYGESDASSIGTVQKLIARLEDKKMLARDNSRQPHLFRPLLDREQVAGLQLDECARKLSEGSLSPFIMHLVQSRKLTRAEKKEIRRLLKD